MSDIVFQERLNRGSSSVLSTTSNVDLKTVGTTNLYTVPAGKKAVITGLTIRPTSISGLISVATIGVGVAAGEADILAATVLTGLTSTSSVFNILAQNIYAIANSADIIKAGVDVGSIGTAFIASIDLLGYLV